MNKTIYFSLCLLLAWVVSTTAQTTSKLDLRTYKRLRNGEVRNENMHLLVKGDVTRIKYLAEQYGGRFKYGYKNIASVEIPEKNLIAFSNEFAVQQIENPNILGKALMDTARIRNNIDSVQAGHAPLPHDMKGRGVIVGIIDGGIYWQHKDFKNPDGTTRIRYIWDEGVTGTNKPLPYNYGNEWNWIDINNGNCTHVEPYNSGCVDYSHGTCVAGIAAGNGSSVEADSFLRGKYTGVAPESEIIVVRIDECVDNFATHLADAVDYIFKKADALGRPCVINTSVGDYYGSHDGKDLTTELIESLLDERNGRVLVAAAGNAGNIQHHLGYTIANDTSYTLFKYSNSAAGVYFDWWADTLDFKQARFAIGCNDTNAVDLGMTAYFGAITDFNPAPNASVAISRSLFDFNQTVLLGQVNLQLTLNDGRYHFEALIDPANTQNLWRLQTTGTGTFDLWSSEALIGGSDIIEYLNGNPITDTHYKHADYNKTIVSSWQCSDKVITVGNYSNRAGYLDVDSHYVDMVNVFPVGETVGSRYVTSSFGPTRDNRIKPDIMATGSTIVCTGDLNDIGLKLASPPNRFKVALGGKHLRNGGTSMASPIVAGIAALYLEKHPTANYDEIKTALICTAVKDSFTSATANSEYGNGKVNAFAALTQTTCITFGAMDTACTNYNPLANVDSGSCIAKVYGCMDSTADNYNPQANVSNGVCSYTGIKNIFGQNVLVQVSPNPFATQTNFKIEGLNFETGEIKIMNQLGSTVDGLKLSSGKANYSYTNDKLPKGVYYYVLNADGKNIKAGKIVIE